ncbi:MAG: hypothetical protein WC700_04190 [Gemmatimonadaceae bacterium]
MSASDRQLFLALTLVVVIVVALMCVDTTTAVVLIAFLLGLASAFFAVAPRRRREHCCGGAAADVEMASSREAFEPSAAPLPGPRAPHALNAPAPAAPPPRRPAYPGAVDFDDYDSEAAYGHRDQRVDDAVEASEGAPYNHGRVAYPQPPEPGYDDEANDAELDGDELNTVQARSRNDAQRVTAGTMNRRRDLDKYFREEVEAAEDQRWWGAHEY